ncbi:MAG: hypothetical protein GY797_33425 [Deltaproteobacteria bacterium]|nr:hypothetical protein [Deltaproteobacteria bacterium]
MTSLMEIAKKVHSGLLTDQNKWLSSWKDIRDYFAPMRGMFKGEQPNDGKMFNQKKLLNGTPARAARDMAAGLTSGMTSPSHPWFELSLENKKLKKTKKVKLWLHTTQELLYSIFRKSNTYSVLNWLYLEFGTFGTGAVMVLSDDDKTIRYRTFTIGEYSLGVNERGEVDKFSRTFKMTIGQVVGLFGIDNVSDQVKQKYTKHEYEHYFDINYLIIPNTNIEIDKARSNRNMPFVSLYWEAKDNNGKFLSISGYEEFPILTPRWEVKNSTVSYGVGPGWVALGDAKMLQKLERDKLLGIGKIIDPPVMLDSSVEGVFNRTPGGVTIFDSTNGPNGGAKPAYQIDIRIGELENAIYNSERKIQKEFYTDLFLLLSQIQRGQKTATEVEGLEDEKRILGPVLDRMDHEILTPLITRTLNIMARQGILPEPPEEIQDEEMTYEYVSVLAKAQKAVRVGTINGIMNFVAGSAEMFPDIIDNIDIDKTIESLSEMTGTPPEIFRDKTEINRIRNVRNQAAQQQQQAEQVSGAIQGAKALSETQIGDKNAIEKISESTGTSL